MYFILLCVYVLKVIHDEKLFVMVGALVFVDVIILSLWSGFDPLQRKLENGTLKVSITKITTQTS
jgi:hypothetical protein